jgi:hypothetical protein
VLLFLSLFLYQNSFVSHHKSQKVFENPLKEDETIFVSIKDHNFSLRKKGFDSLTESLRFWNYDNKTGNVFLKEQSLLPSEFTPLVFVYDRGNDSFEKQENVLPISTFPYFIYQNNFELEIIDIDKEGTLYFHFQDKKLSLEKGQTYKTLFLDGLKVRSISIENFGLKKLNQFKLFPEVEAEIRKEKERIKKEEELLKKKNSEDEKTLKNSEIKKGDS